MNATLSSRTPQRARLSASLAAALALLSLTDDATSAAASRTRDARLSDDTVRYERRLTPMSHFVMNCDDGFAPGTLRWVLADPATQSGDVVDLTQLQCSRISLGSELKIHQDNLTLIGPEVAFGYFTLDAQFQSEAIQHFGYGTLELSNIDIERGSYESAADPTGGCIWSRGSIALTDSHVTHCAVLSLSSSVPALGGAIYVRGNLTLTRSTISHSTAYSNIGGKSAGGGAFVMGQLRSDDSSITDNAARTINGGYGRGGGAFVRNGADIRTTTISGNRADDVGGLMLYDALGSTTATITNSTVSGNRALALHGGIYSKVPLTLASSTIAFNSARNGASTGNGVFATASLDLQNTLLADNAGGGGLSDVDSAVPTTISGAHNLIVSAGPQITLPIDTVTECPRLDVLLNSGGATTATHRLRQGSHAIDEGDAGSLSTDQRGLPRVVGVGADIGSVERQGNEAEERIMSSGYEGPCDL